MYRTIIKIKKDTPSELLKWIGEQCKSAFDNRAGKAENRSNDEYVYIFEGKENLYGCLELGMFDLKGIQGFINCVQTWEWIDEEPSESCNMLEVFARHAK